MSNIFFEKDNLTVIAARPGMGTTSLVLNIALNAAKAENKNVLFFSLDNSKEVLSNRIFCMLTEIDQNKLHSALLDNEEIDKIESASEHLSKLSISIDDTPKITVPYIRSKLNKSNPPDLVIVDKLELMTSLTHTNNRSAMISDITHHLKNISKEFHIPIIVVAQLSRDLEKRNDKRPVLTDLKEYKSIEPYADIVWLLHRDSYYDYHKDPELFEVIIGKHFRENIDSLKLRWKSEINRFYAVCF